MYNLDCIHCMYIYNYYYYYIAAGPLHLLPELVADPGRLANNIA